MKGACISVGKSGYGPVPTSVGESIPSLSKVTEPPCSTRNVCAPRKGEMTAPITEESAPAISTLPPHTATADITVPATILSFTGSTEAPSRASTPLTVTTGVPSPEMSAPILTSRRTRETISGSRAAPMSRVVPSAFTAAMMRFSVAPTLG